MFWFQYQPHRVFQKHVCARRNLSSGARNVFDILSDLPQCCDRSIRVNRASKAHGGMTGTEVPHGDDIPTTCISCVCGWMVKVLPSNVSGFFALNPYRTNSREFVKKRHQRTCGSLHIGRLETMLLAVGCGSYLYYDSCLVYIWQ